MFAGARAKILGPIPKLAKNGLGPSQAQYGNGVRGEGLRHGTVLQARVYGNGGPP